MEVTPVLALLGCGIFARDVYVPILRNLKVSISLGFVWSRSEASARRLLEKVEDFAPDARPAWGEEGLQLILSASGVDCCAVVLPILVQVPMVFRLLSAGKHVLQEKPIAGSLNEGVKAVQLFQEQFARCNSKNVFWAVAENYRFEPAFYKAQELIKELGTMVVVQMTVEVPMNFKSKYFDSQWRRDPALKGAFITDCGVHFVAGLRLMIGRNNIVSVTAVATHRDVSVPPPDTLTALLKFQNGCSGVLVITYASSNQKASWRVVCSGGSVQVDRGCRGTEFGFTNLWEVTCAPVEGKSSSEFFPLMGVEQELQAFATDVSRAKAGQAKGVVVADRRSSPLEALEDLAVVEALLASGLHPNAPTEVAIANPLSSAPTSLPVNNFEHVA